MNHVVFLGDAALDAILAGQKSRELRLSENWAPFMHVAPGHRLFLKRTGGAIEALADVRAVDQLDPDKRSDFVARFAIGPLETAYLKSKTSARYGVAILIGHVRPITFAADRTPRRIRMGWVADFDPGDWRETVAN